MYKNTPWEKENLNKILYITDYLQVSLFLLQSFFSKLFGMTSNNFLQKYIKTFLQ